MSEYLILAIILFFIIFSFFYLVKAINQLSENPEKALLADVKIEQKINPLKTETTPGNEIICKNCNKKIEKDSNFCKYCGHKI